jgi:hypothetical protein
MNVTEDDFAQAADAIQNSAFAQPILELLDRIVDRGGAQELVSEIVSRQHASGAAAEERAVSQAHRLLESLGNASEPIACRLLAHLYPVASERRMHDVCNSIDLWMAHCDSDALTRYLKLIIQSEPDPKMRRHYDTWIGNKS